MMYKELKNEYGCSLENQDGRMAVRDFDGVIARLSPELRAAFEAERAARRAELEALRAAEAREQGARVGRIARPSKRRVRFIRVFRRIREVGSAELVAKPCLRVIARYRAAARHEAEPQNIAERVLSEADLAAPAVLDTQCAPSRHLNRCWRDHCSDAICSTIGRLRLGYGAAVGTQISVRSVVGVM